MMKNFLEKLLAALVTVVGVLVVAVFASVIVATIIVVGSKELLKNYLPG